MEKTGVRGQGSGGRKDREKRRNGETEILTYSPLHRFTASPLHFNILTAYCLLLTVLLLLTGCGWTKGAVKGGDAAPLYAEGEVLYQKGRYSEAAERLKMVMEEHPLSHEAIDAQLLLADVYYSNEQYEDGASYYTNFVALHPSHPKAPYAQFQKGMSYFKQILTIDRDQIATKKALFAFQDLLQSYPTNLYVDKAREMIAFLKRRLAEREFYIGSFYFKDKNYRGALARFAEVLKTYPDVGLTDKALYYIGEAYRRLGEKELAREAFSTLLSSYPNSPFASVARGRLERI